MTLIRGRSVRLEPLELDGSVRMLNLDTSMDGLFEIPRLRPVLPAGTCVIVKTLSLRVSPEGVAARPSSMDTGTATRLLGGSSEEGQTHGVGHLLKKQIHTRAAASRGVMGCSSTRVEQRAIRSSVAILRRLLASLRS